MKYNSGIKNKKALYVRASQIYSDGYKYHSSNNSQSVSCKSGMATLVCLLGSCASSAPFFVQNKRKCLKTALEYQRVTEDGRVV